LLQRTFGIATIQRELTEQEPGGSVLPQHSAFTTLPRVEAAGGEQVEGFLRAAG
jgi:hypothetical protein